MCYNIGHKLRFQQDKLYIYIAYNYTCYTMEYNTRLNRPYDSLPLLFSSKLTTYKILKTTHYTLCIFIQHNRLYESDFLGDTIGNKNK